MFVHNLPNSELISLEPKEAYILFKKIQAPEVVVVGADEYKNHKNIQVMITFKKRKVGTKSYKVCLV